MAPRVRKGQGSTKLSKDEFGRRMRERFYDPSFGVAGAEVDGLVEIAWSGYQEYRKSPRKQKAGPGFADPEYELPVEWLATRRGRNERSFNSIRWRHVTR